MQYKFTLLVVFFSLIFCSTSINAQVISESSVEDCTLELKHQIPDADLSDLADFCQCIVSGEGDCAQEYPEFIDALLPETKTCAVDDSPFSMTQIFPDLHNNNHLMNRTELLPEDVSAVQFNFESLNYLKNNEYFNKIANGNTLFGYQFFPSLSYQPTENIKIKAGAYMQREYGSDRSSKVIPTFSIKVQKNDFSFIFGNLESSLDHQLSDPLYDYEKTITDRIEEGLQFLLVKEKVFLDVWIDWENYLRPLDDDQETFSGGASFIYKVADGEYLTVTLPLQVIFLHNGGQIGVEEQPNSNFLNTAAGVSVQLNIQDNGFFKYLRLEETYAKFRDFGKETFTESYKDGGGINSKLTLSTKFMDIRATHWRAHRYITIKGDEQYSSLSSNYDNPGNVQSTREFFTLSLQKNITISDGLVLAFRFEPIWEFDQNKNNINSPFHEYSYGCSLSYKLQNIHLAKVKKLKALQRKP